MIEMLRRLGVTHYKSQDVELTLLPTTLVEMSIQEPYEPSIIAETPVIGDDGLTPEQQEELYGRRMSDTRR